MRISYSDLLKLLLQPLGMYFISTNIVLNIFSLISGIIIFSLDMWVLAWHHSLKVQAYFVILLVFVMGFCYIKNLLDVNFLQYILTWIYISYVFISALVLLMGWGAIISWEILCLPITFFYFLLLKYLAVKYGDA